MRRGRYARDSGGDATRSKPMLLLGWRDRAGTSWLGSGTDAVVAGEGLRGMWARRPDDVAGARLRREHKRAAVVPIRYRDHVTPFSVNQSRWWLLWAGATAPTLIRAHHGKGCSDLGITGSFDAGDLEFRNAWISRNAGRRIRLHFFRRCARGNCDRGWGPGSTGPRAEATISGL